MSLIKVPGEVSKIGIKKEQTHGTAATGNYRGLLVSDFEAHEEKEASPYALASGVKGTYDNNVSGSHQAISFTSYAAPTDLTKGSLIDLVHMIMDRDAVTSVGGGVYKHTFSMQTVSKPSWSFWHDDGKSDTAPRYIIYNGFVADTMEITIDKSDGKIPINMSGMAWQESDGSSKTCPIGSMTLWSPKDAVITIGGSTIYNFNSCTISFACGTEVNNVINDTKYPSRIDGTTLTCSISLKGFWNDATISETLMDAWRADSVQSTELNVKFGSNSTNDYFTLILPKYRLSDSTYKTVAMKSELPQNIELNSIHQGDTSTNGFSIEILDQNNVDWDSLS